MGNMTLAMDNERAACGADAQPSLSKCHSLGSLLSLSTLQIDPHSFKVFQVPEG